jgi:hypothetical protein
VVFVMKISWRKLSQGSLTLVLLFIDSLQDIFMSKKSACGSYQHQTTFIFHIVSIADQKAESQEYIYLLSRFHNSLGLDNTSREDRQRGHLILDLFSF